jgi:hypothetical protein
MSDVTRFQVEIDQAEMDELERLQQLGGLRTKRELLNTAMTLLKWAARERGRGCAIVSVDDRKGQLKELEMPFLEAIYGKSRDNDSGLIDHMNSGVPQKVPSRR